jgi:hypothetical protein
MSMVTFRGYGPGSREITVMVERITHWCLIDYNGNYGTRIVLDTNKELNVGEWPDDVEKRVLAALAAKASS